MIVLSEMVKDIIFGDDYSDREKVLLLKKLIVPELKVDGYTERLARLCDADKERAKERAERRREQNRQAQQRYRESHVQEPSEPVSKVSDSKQASAGVSKSKQSKHLTDTDTEPINTIKDIDRTDSDVRVGARTRGGAGKKGVVPAWTMDDGRLLSGEFPTTTILRSALGRGCWRSAIDQLGEATVLGEFGVFRAEINAGEVVENPAAAFTARLKKLGFRPGRRKQGFSGVSGSGQG